jgi:hypothetical protein
MSGDTQQQISDLQEQLTAARRSAEETRAGMTTVIDRVATEARLYRSLFWSILSVAAMATLLYLLHQ